jgi:hypothetical protein
MADQDRDAAWAARMEKWWADWWAADYSWDGLAKKDWRGWVRPEDGGPCVPEMDGVVGRQATLQDYFRDRLGSDLPLIASPDGTRQFTRLHLPLKWPDGTKTEKADWPGDALDADLRVLFAAAEGPRKEDEEARPAPDRSAQCDGVVFLTVDLTTILPDATRDQDDRIPLSLSCFGTFFSGDADFERAAFSGYANFNSAAFSGNAEFISAAFSGNAEFISAAFSGVAGFMSAAFSRKADFSSAAFSGYANFSSAAFSGDADFESAAFSFFVDFSSAAFSGDADFFSATFPDYANFYSAAFSGQADFRSAAFSRYAFFNSAAFSGNADFSSAAFSGRLALDRAHFEGKATFAGAGLATSEPEVRRALSLTPTDGDPPGSLQGAVIAPPVLLPLARRAFQSISAEGAVFLDDADFTNRDILQPSSFAGAWFLGLADFHGSRLHQRVNLYDTAFEALDSPRLEPGASRVGSWRRGEVDPETKKRRAPVPSGRWPPASLTRLDAVRRAAKLPPLANLYDLPDRQWQGAVDKWAVTVNNERQLRAAKAPKPDDKRYEAIEASFRTLKLAMEDTRARLSESNFFKLELKARRRRRDRDIWEQVFSDLYGAMSDYGASAFRPVIWLVGALFGFAALYWFGVWAGRGFVMTPPPDFRPGWLWIDPDAWNALRYSASRMLPFGALAEDDWAWSKVLLSDTWGGGTARVLATIQSLLAAVLTFQFALAVRRRFQIT